MPGDWVNNNGQWEPVQGGFGGDFTVSELPKPLPDDDGTASVTPKLPPNVNWVQGTYSSVDRRPCLTWGRSWDWGKPMGRPGCPGFSENYRLPYKNGRRAYPHLSDEEKAIAGLHLG